MFEYFSHCAMAGRLGKQILRNTGKCQGQPKLIYISLYSHFVHCQDTILCSRFGPFHYEPIFDKPSGNFVYECQDARTV